MALEQIPNSGTRTPRSRSSLVRFIVPFFFLLILVLILRNEVPEFNVWLEQMLQPEQARARQACRDAGLAKSVRPGFARIISDGQVHATRDGFYVEGLVIGEPGDTGAEQTFRFSCYVDSGGRLVTSQREAAPAAK